MRKRIEGSIELIVLALLAALIVVLAIPVLTNLGNTTHDTLTMVDNQMDNALQEAQARMTP